MYARAPTMSGATCAAVRVAPPGSLDLRSGRVRRSDSLREGVPSTLTPALRSTGRTCTQGTRWRSTRIDATSTSAGLVCKTTELAIPPFTTCCACAELNSMHTVCAHMAVQIRHQALFPQFQLSTRQLDCIW